MNKKYKNINEMVSNITDDKDFSRKVADEIKRKRIAKILFSIRLSKGLSQNDVAKKLGVTQSKISKLESSNDEEISIGDLESVCQALDHTFELRFFKKGITKSEKVKYHYFCLKAHLDDLREMAKGDLEIEKGVEDFTKEAFVNITMGLFECLEKASKLSGTKNDKPMEVIGPFDNESIKRLVQNN